MNNYPGGNQLDGINIMSEEEAAYLAALFNNETTNFADTPTQDASVLNPLQTQPQLQAPSIAQTPADCFDPVLNIWYNDAPAGAPGAYYHKTIGWHFRVAVGADASTPSAMTSGLSTPVDGQMGFTRPQTYGQLAMTSGISTPVNGQMGFSQTQMYTQPTMQPPQNPYHVPGGLLYGQQQQGGYAFADPDGASGANPMPPPVQSRRKKGVDSSKKVSIKQTCTCKAPKQKISRPKNCWVLYRMHYQAQFRDQNTQAMREGRQQDIVTQPEISKLLAAQWANESAANRATWMARAAQEAATHALLNPGYTYQPQAAKAARFGDENCTCGAYEANMEHAENKAGKPTRRPYTKKARTTVAADSDDLPVFDPGFPVAPMAPMAPVSTYGNQMQPATQLSGGANKRKYTAGSEEEEQPLRRSPRHRSQQPGSYTESTEVTEESEQLNDDLFGEREMQPEPATNMIPQNIRSTGLSLPTRPAPIQTAPAPPQPNSPARNTRSRSQTPIPSSAFGIDDRRVLFDTGYENNAFGELFHDGMDFDFDNFLNESPKRASNKDSKSPTSKKSSRSSGGSVVSPSGRRRSVRIAQREDEP